MKAKQDHSIQKLSAMEVNRKRIALAKKIWESSSPLSGTPAEKYLVESRKIPESVLESMSIRSYQGRIGIAEFDKNKPCQDYVLVPVYDLDNDLIGLQIIQVDNDGNKATHPTSLKFYPKKYFGGQTLFRSGHAAVLQMTHDLRMVFIAEGIETAASIAALPEISDRFSVLASLGVTEFSKVLGFLQTHFPPGCIVVLLKDNDGDNPLSAQCFENAKQKYEEAGYRVIALEPFVNGDRKKPTIQGYDWNDVLREGLGQLQSQIVPKISIDPLKMKQAEKLEKLKNQYQTVMYYIRDAEKIIEKHAITSLMLNAISEINTKMEHLENDLHSGGTNSNSVGTELQLIKSFATRGMQMDVAKDFAKFHFLIEFNERLNALEESKTQALTDHLDIFDEMHPNDAPNGDLAKAYFYSLQYCHNYLKDLKKVEGNTDITDLSIRESKFDPDVSPTFSHYYRIFIRVINEQLRERQTNLNFIRKTLESTYRILRNELENRYESDKRILVQEYSKESQAVKEEITFFLEHLREQIVFYQIDLDIKQEERLTYAKQSYLQAMESFQENSNAQKILQQWLNQLSSFRVGSPFIFNYPLQETSVGKIEILEEDLNEKENLDQLTEYLWFTIHNRPLNESEQIILAAMPSILMGYLKRGLCSQKQILTLAIFEYCRQLSIELSKSFMLVDPKTHKCQEFDGIALRNGKLIIIERKTNDGTGSGFLQRNFCQNKINAKEKFLREGIVRRILSENDPLNFILLKEPKDSKLFSCEELTNEIKNKLIRNAKLLIVEAIDTFSLEFILNRPERFNFEDYKGVFFNTHLTKQVSMRFSRFDRGNERVAHEFLDSLPSLGCSSSNS